MLPNEFFKLVRKIRERFPEIELSVHCHNDLGLATANSIAAINAGADQIHCTINGIGERAGNAALEEIAAILSVKKGILNASCNINLREIANTSEIVSKAFGIEVPYYKAIVGKNAMKHEAGVHVQYYKGYELFNPDDIGSKREIVLGKHSGLHTILELAKINKLDISIERAKSLLEEVKRMDLKISQRDFAGFLEKHK